MITVASLGPKAGQVTGRRDVAHLELKGLVPAELPAVEPGDDVDHVGFATRLDGGRWVPAFPSARYLTTAQELETILDRTTEADEPGVSPVFDGHRIVEVEVLSCGDCHAPSTAASCIAFAGVVIASVRAESGDRPGDHPLGGDRQSATRSCAIDAKTATSIGNDRPGNHQV